VINIRDIRSLTEFKRHTAEFLSDLRETGRPHVLTVNGRARLVVQDAEAYQRFMELVRRAEAIEGIRRGLEDVEKGRTSPARKALAALRKKHTIRRDR